ncbi:uncharacterized protein LOC129971474 [Argiope bruennichi]|uniref:uncharacterized protein LOC129971474 n=1 Tax=Argiope bruennichi TaxID=94029 RepID=UPI002494E5B3|nr:uncharacterized protein LOC129971474 [Argiope bruennichi]
MNAGFLLFNLLLYLSTTNAKNAQEDGDANFNGHLEDDYGLIYRIINTLNGKSGWQPPPYASIVDNGDNAAYPVNYIAALVDGSAPRDNDDDELYLSSGHIRSPHVHYHHHQSGKHHHLPKRNLRKTKKSVFMIQQFASLHNVNVYEL